MLAANIGRRAARCKKEARRGPTPTPPGPPLLVDRIELRAEVESWVNVADAPGAG